MSPIRLDGLNETLQSFASFANANETNGSRVALLGSTERRISIVAGSGVPAREINDLVRDTFINAVVAQYGGKLENVPVAVRSALNLGDYGQGKPLTARNIRAVFQAVEGKAPAASPADVRAAEAYSLELPQSAPAVKDPPWTSFFAVKEDNTSDHTAQSLPPEDGSAVDKGVHESFVAAGGKINDAGSNEERGVVARKYYNPTDGRDYRFNEYEQGGAGGNHCFFLSALRHMGITPSAANAKSLRRMMRDIVDQAIASAGTSPSPLTRNEKGELFFGTVSLAHLEETFNAGIFDETSKDQADLATGVVLAHVLKRPVVMVSTNNQGVSSFQTFDRDLLTGETFERKDLAYIHYVPGHFQALEMVSADPLQPQRPVDRMCEKLFPQDVAPNVRTRLAQAVLQGLDAQLPAQCRASDRYLASRIDEIAQDPARLESFREAARNAAEIVENLSAGDIQSTLLPFFL